MAPRAKNQLTKSDGGTAAEVRRSGRARKSSTRASGDQNAFDEVASDYGESDYATTDKATSQQAAMIKKLQDQIALLQAKGDNVVHSDEDELEGDLTSEIDRVSSGPEFGPVTSATTSPLRLKTEPTLEAPSTPSPVKGSTKMLPTVATTSESEEDEPIATLRLGRAAKVGTADEIANKKKRPAPPSPEVLVVAETPKPKRKPNRKKVVKSDPFCNDSDIELVDKPDVQSTPQVKGRVVKGKGKATPAKKKAQSTMPVTVQQVDHKISVKGTVGPDDWVTPLSGPIEDRDENPLLDMPDTQKSPTKKRRIAISDDEVDTTTPVMDPLGTPMTEVSQRLAKSQLASAKKPSADKAGLPSSSTKESLDEFAIKVEDAWNRKPIRDQISDLDNPAHVALMCESLQSSYKDLPKLRRPDIEIVSNSGDLAGIKLRQGLSSLGIMPRSGQELFICTYVTQSCFGPYAINPARSAPELFYVKELGTTYKTPVIHRGGFLPHEVDLTAKKDAPVAMVTFGFVAQSRLLEPYQFGKSKPFHKKSIEVVSLNVEVIRGVSFTCMVMDKKAVRLPAFPDNCLSYGTRTATMKEQKSKIKASAMGLNGTPKAASQFGLDKYAASRKFDETIHKLVTSSSTWPGDSMLIYDASMNFQSDTPHQIRQGVANYEEWHDEIPVDSLVQIFWAPNFWGESAATDNAPGVDPSLTPILLCVVIIALPEDIFRARQDARAEEVRKANAQAKADADAEARLKAEAEAEAVAELEEKRQKLKAKFKAEAEARLLAAAATEPDADAAQPPTTSKAKGKAKAKPKVSARVSKAAAAAAELAAVQAQLALVKTQLELAKAQAQSSDPMDVDGDSEGMLDDEAEEGEEEDLVDDDEGEGDEVGDESVSDGEDEYEEDSFVVAG